MNKKYDMYQDKDGNVYNLTTEVEQLMTEALIELQDKIDKAIEYIERLEINSIGTPYSYTERGKDLLSILKGENNE